MLKKIISGGQSGADITALEIAALYNLQTGGYAPMGYVTENGPNLELKKFGLEECMTSSYAKRSMLNVDNSDGTLAFSFIPSIGTDKTIGYCITKKWQITSINTTGDVYKPIFIINQDALYRESLPLELKTFIHKNNIETLNVCGHRKSRYKDIDSIVHWTMRMLFIVLEISPDLWR